MAEDVALGYRQLWAIGLASATFLVVFVGFCFAAHFVGNEPVPYLDDKEPFKYGSSGGKRECGIPYWICKLLVKMLPDDLPGKTYAPRTEYVSLGFLHDFFHPLAIFAIESGSLHQAESCTP